MHLLHEVAGEEAQALPRLHRRPRQHDARDLALHQGGDRHRHRQVRLPGARGADRDDQIVPAHRLEVALLVRGLRGDEAASRRHRDGVGQHRLDVGARLVPRDAQGRADVGGAERGPLPQHGHQLPHHPLAP